MRALCTPMLDQVHAIAYNPKIWTDLGNYTFKSDAFVRIVVNSMDDAMSDVTINPFNIAIHAHRYYRNEYDECGSAAVMFKDDNYIGTVVRRYGTVTYNDLGSYKKAKNVCDGTDEILGDWSWLYPELPPGFKYTLIKCEFRRIDPSNYSSSDINANNVYLGSHRSLMSRWPFNSSAPYSQTFSCSIDSDNIATVDGFWLYYHHPYKDVARNKYYPTLAFGGNNQDGWSCYIGDFYITIRLDKVYYTLSKKKPSNNIGFVPNIREVS